jgi:hypothetical protein
MSERRLITPKPLRRRTIILHPEPSTHNTTGDFIGDYTYLLVLLLLLRNARRLARRRGLRSSSLLGLLLWRRGLSLLDLLRRRRELYLGYLGCLIGLLLLLDLLSLLLLLLRLDVGSG